MEIAEISCPSINNISSKKVKFLSKSISPIKILGLFGSEEYEELIKIWCYYYLKKKNNYEKIAHLGGSGDKGRDIAAYYNYKEWQWDNFQCKHYENALNPSTTLTEIGKLCYNCYSKELKNPPKQYFFVSPKGVSTQTHDLLASPEKIKLELLSKWDNLCKNKITSKNSINLDKELTDYINAFNFSIFTYIEPTEFLEQFKETPYYTEKFGELSKPRNLEIYTPEEIQQDELTYIKKILDAYAEYLKTSNTGKEILNKDPSLKADFERQRICFFTADSLKQFSRDIYPPEQDYFGLLKQEMYDGIIETISEDAENGLVRLRKVLNRATELQITNNPLIEEAKINDKKGICHHLANERDDVKWVK